MPQDLYAYTLRNQEPGWSWHVYDIEGDVVANGLETTQRAAFQAVTSIIGQGAPQAMPLARAS